MVTHSVEVFCSDATQALFQFLFWICPISIIIIEASNKCVVVPLSGWQQVQNSFCTVELLVSIGLAWAFYKKRVSTQVLISSPFTLSVKSCEDLLSKPGCCVQHARATSEHLQRPVDSHTERENIQGLSSSPVLEEIRGPESCTSIFTSSILLTFLRLFLIYDNRRLKRGSGRLRASCWNPQGDQISHCFTSE